MTREPGSSDILQVQADLEEVCRLVAEGKRVTDPDLLKRIEERSAGVRELEPAVIPPELLAKLEEAVDHAMRGVRDPKAMDQAAREMEAGREELYRRLGEVDLAVELTDRDERGTSSTRASRSSGSFPSRRPPGRYGF